MKAIGAKEIAVVFVDDTDEQAKAYGVMDNRSAELAEWDLPGLKDILESLDTGAFDMDLTGFDTESIENLMTQIHQPDEAGESTTEDHGIFAYREDAIFPSSNKWGIPDLREDMLSSQIPLDTWAPGVSFENPQDKLFLWGTGAFAGRVTGGTLGFYVDDKRFETVWHEAVKYIDTLKTMKLGSIITPDFSMWQNAPLIIQLWNLYRSRWCARYWQDAGFKVIPSLNWSDERTYEFAACGLPNNMPVVSVQCRTTKSAKGREYFLKGITELITKITPQNVLIYGGTEHMDWLNENLPTCTQYHFLDSWTFVRSQIRKKGGDTNESS